MEQKNLNSRLNEFTFTTPRKNPANILAKAGINTVQDLINRASDIKDLKGIGEGILLDITTNPEISDLLGDEIISQIMSGEKKPISEPDIAAPITSTDNDGVLIRLNKYQVEIVIMAIESSIVGSKMPGVRQELIDQIIRSVNNPISNIAPAEGVDGILCDYENPPEPEFKRFISWIDDGRYHEGRDIKFAVKDYLRDAIDEVETDTYADIAEFDIKYVSVPNGGFPLAGKSWYTIKRRGNDLVVMKRQH